MQIMNIKADALPAMVKIIEDAQAALSRVTGLDVKLTLSVTGQQATYNEAVWLVLQQEICRIAKCSWKTMQSHSRKHPLPLYRQAYLYVGKYLIGGKSLREMGIDLGGRDHTTAIHSIQRFQQLLDTEDELATELYNRLQTIILNAPPPNEN